jgi:phage terminase large subunit GpA-like protein
MSSGATAAALKRDLYGFLEPPPVLRLSEWAEENIVLPEGSRARPGAYRNWPYFTEILDAMADPNVERVTLMKSARVG